MAYDSRLTGRLTIEPPLMWRQFKDFPLRAADSTASAPRSVVLRENVATTETATSRVCTITAVAVVPATAERVGHYGLDDELALLAEAFGAHHTFDGWLMREGANLGDVQRYTIRDGAVVAESASLTWPDGSPVA